jgi:hypothetical protein
MKHRVDPESGPTFWSGAQAGEQMKKPGRSRAFDAR